MNKRINRSNKKTASNEKIEKNKNIIKNELASVSNTVSNNEKLVKEFSEQQQQPDQKRYLNFEPFFKRFIYETNRI